MSNEFEPPEFCPKHREVCVEPSMPCEYCSGPDSDCDDPEEESC